MNMQCYAVYWLRNCWNVIGKDRKYFSQIWNTVLVKITDSIEMYSSSYYKQKNSMVSAKYLEY